MLAKRTGITQCLTNRYNTLESCGMATRFTSDTQADVEAESDTGSLPDRLINPEEYEPVLLTAEKHTAAEATESIDPAGNKEERKLSPVYTYGSIS